MKSFIQDKIIEIIIHDLLNILMIYKFKINQEIILKVNKKIKKNVLN